MHKAFIIFLLLLFKLVPASAQADWKLSTESEGIKVYTGTVHNSKINAVKVECDFHTSLSQFVAVLLDIKGSVDWLYHTKLSTIIKQVSPQELYYYCEVSLPWPAENRDFVCHLSVSQDAQSKVVTVNGPAVTGYVPIKDNKIRISNSASRWTITPAGNNEISVVYTLHADPGGALPAWLVNMFVTDGPVQIFKNLKLQLQKPAYKNAVLPFIRD